MRSPEPLIIYHEALAATSQELESSNHDPRLALLIEDNAVEHSTFFSLAENSDTSLIVDLAALPQDLASVLYLPPRIKVGFMESRLSELPASHNLPLAWSLTTKLHYKDAGPRAANAPYTELSLISTDAQTTLTAPGPDGRAITKILGPEVGGELIFSFLAHVSSHCPEKPVPGSGLNVALLSQALATLGSRLGEAERTTVAQILDAEAGNRSLVIASSEKGGTNTSSETTLYSYLIEIGDGSDKYTIMESSHYEVVSSEDVAVRSLIERKGRRYRTVVNPDDHALAFQTGMQGHEKAKEFDSRIRREDYDLISMGIMSTLRPALKLYGDPKSTSDRSDDPVDPERL